MSDPHSVEPLILVIEDDEALVTSLRRVLTESGYRVGVAGSGAEARAVLDELHPRLILLDLMLPDTDGLVLAATLKALQVAPIIMMSARTRQADRVLGLKLGADDFVAKPFDVDELLARVEAVLRRTTPPRPAPSSTERLDLGDLSIVPSRAEVIVGHQTIQLTPTEYRVLHALATHVNEVVTREDLIQRVWGYHDAGPSAAHLVDVHVGRLRQKLHRARLRTPHIVTARKRGFTLSLEEAEPVGASVDAP